MSYNKLRGKIREAFGTQEAFALAMGIDVSTLSQKLNGKVEFKQTEIIRACNLLNIPITDVHIYFFAVKVGISKQDD